MRKHLLGVGLLLSFACTSADPDAGKPPWSDCPVPEEASIIDLDEQFEAWNAAKRISGFYTFVKKWPLPCMAVRVTRLFSGDPDGEGGLPPGLYQGIHLPPTPFMRVETGRVLACEYVVVFLPEDQEDQVGPTLVHEYLHTIFYRLHTLFPAFAEKHKPEDSEAWVRSRLGG